MENKEIKKLLEYIKKLESEGFLSFRRTKSDVIDFIENDMNYIVFEKDGVITKYTSCRAACGKTWNQVKSIKMKHTPSDQDKAYFIENNLKMSYFNFNCWKELGVVFLNKHEHEVIKFHQKEKK